MSLFGQYINPMNLIRGKAGLPVLALSMMGLTAMSFGTGVVHKVGSLVTGMYLGILVFGWLLDQTYLNSAGIKKAMGMRNSGGAELASRRVESWNRSVSVGAEVTYMKSELEGKLVLKTVGPAYLFGGEPAVDLEHIGVALLNKVEPFSG